VLLPIACGGRSLPGEGLSDSEGGESGGTAAFGGYGADNGGGRGGFTGGSAGEGGVGGSPAAGGSFAGFAGSAMAGAAGSAGAAGRSGGTAGSGFGLAGGSFGGVAGNGGGGSAGMPSGLPFEPNALGGCDVSLPVDGGFERCESGLLHRPAVGVCNDSLPRTSAFGPGVLSELELAASAGGLTPEQIEGLYPCREDAQCVDRANGYCSLVSALGWTGSDITQCRYACTSDLECGGGTICQCDVPAGRCVTASCATDAECGAGLHCALEDVPDDCTPQIPPVWTCQTHDDECAQASDCPDGDGCMTRNGRRQCLPALCSD
jgi:hypothetical protein